MQNGKKPVPKGYVIYDSIHKPFLNNKVIKLENIVVVAKGKKRAREEGSVCGYKSA